MAIYPLIERGEHQHDANGVARYKVRVYDALTDRQINRRVTGLTQAKSAEADLLAQVQVTLEERRASAEVVAAGVRKGRPVATTTTKITVREWGIQYLNLYGRRPDGTTRPPSSVAHDRRCLEIYIFPRIGERTLASIRLSELDDLVAGLTKKDGVTLLAGSTKESVAGTIKLMWKMARRRDILTENTAADLSSTWGGKSETRAAIVPSMADVCRLSACAEDQGEAYGAVVELLAFTGMRWEELNAVLVDDVNWLDASISVHWTATYEDHATYTLERRARRLLSLDRSQGLLLFGPASTHGLLPWGAAVPPKAARSCTDSCTATRPAS